MGLALSPDDGKDPDRLFLRAESALKKAKASGERYLFYAETMSERVAENLSLEDKLRTALKREEFVLHYQPKVDIDSRRVVGLEALIRWQSAELGLVPPMQFIPLLEETGMILEVGRWAFRRAVLDQAHWAAEGLHVPRIAVNVSAIQLRQRNFVESVTDALGGRYAIDLEITESRIMEDIDANIEKLKRLRALGIGIAIDDFGTGYSSLAYLARLPVQTLKIDRAFISRMLQDDETMALVQTIISLARSLNLSTVAEGVESEEQADMLGLLRCDQLQGYLISKPLPPAETMAFLRQSQGR
jgi:EAL domain-containing protein (putative c-di-GMP-specific phosphodiesterase class I)